LTPPSPAEGVWIFPAQRNASFPAASPPILLLLTIGNTLE
jgi:hypothetical protein